MFKNNNLPLGCVSVVTRFKVRGGADDMEEIPLVYFVPHSAPVCVLYSGHTGGWGGAVSQTGGRNGDHGEIAGCEVFFVGS